MRNQISRFLVIALLLATTLVAGCAVTVNRANPNLQVRADSIQTVALLNPDVEVFQLDTGGTTEKIEEWSLQAKNNLITAIEEEFKSRSLVSVKPYPEDAVPEDIKSNLDETYTLLEPVTLSIIMHTSPGSPWLFEDKVKNFDYSLGNEVQALKINDANVMLLVKGVDHIWTQGRKALQAFGVVLGIGAAVGTGVVVIPRLGGGTAVIVALVDTQDGNILWYNQIAADSGYDLRDRDSVGSLVKGLFDDLPIGKKPVEEKPTPRRRGRR